MAFRGKPVDGSLKHFAVSFRSVTCRLGSRTILDNVSFEVSAGDTLVLLGRSGSGKTTALRMINALLKPTSGEVLVGGKPPSADPIPLRRRIGYVIQESGLLPHWTVAGNVGLVPRMIGWSPDRIGARVSELLHKVGLDPEIYSNRWPHELSGGQRQRVGIARALAADPPLLLFDEPFGALDPVTRRELQDEFLELQRAFHKTAVFVTHDVREAARLATKIVVLSEGRLDFEGTPDEFRATRMGEAGRFAAVLSE